MLPNFLVIGAQRSGTTSLYLSLARHRQVFMSQPKEPHYFLGEDLLPWQYYPGQKIRLWHDRVSRFSDYERLFDGASGYPAVGEASVWYLHRPEAAARIKDRLPAVKMIALLRDPVERAFSDYKQGLTLGYEQDDDFGTAIEADERRIRERTGFARYYVEQGFYHRHLQRFFELFDREQLRIYLHDDFRNRSAEMLRDLWDFLEVDASEAGSAGIRRANASPPGYELLTPKSAWLGALPTVPRRVIVPRQVGGGASGRRLTFGARLRRARKWVQDPRYRRMQTALRLRRLGWVEASGFRPNLDAAVRQELRRVYREDIRALEDLLRRDLSHWRGE